MCSISYTHIHTHTHARMGPMDTPFPPSFLISPPPFLQLLDLGAEVNMHIYTYTHYIYTLYIHTCALLHIVYISPPASSMQK